MQTFVWASPIGFWTVDTTETHLMAMEYRGAQSPTARKPQTDLELRIHEMLERYLAKEAVDFSVLPIHYPVSPNPKSANLIPAVMKQLLQIPYGTVYSYQWMAEQLGRPQAMRAVGNALGRNTIPVIVPCHRIVAKHNKLGGFMRGYADGGRIKTFLLELEGHQLEGDKLVESPQARLALRF